MPLTGAEKTRRYREKLKRDRPEEYKAQCKKNLERMKSKKKKISEMTAEEAEKQRKIWREEKKRSNMQKKKQNKPAELRNIDNVPCITTKDNNETKIRIKCKQLLRKCRNLLTQVKKVQTQRENYKKRYQRLKQRTTKKITDLENELMKQKSREEVLEFTLKKTYQRAKGHTEKQYLRELVKNTTNKKYVRKMMGLKAKDRKKKKRVRFEIEEITKFYLRDDVSRNTAGKKQAKTRNKIRKQIRYLIDTFTHLYTKYRSEGGRYGFTTFYKHKPFYVLTPHMNARDTCLCIRHSNVKFQHTSLKKHGLLKNGVTEILNEISCDTKNYSCMYSNCENCKDRKPLYCTLENGVDDNDKNVSWLRWERKDHTYTKKGDQTNEIKTKRTEKVIKTGSLENLKNEFEQDLKEFKRHYFNMQRQHNQYQMAVSQLKDNEVVLVCDFSENYEAKLGEEIQAMHFGASKNQLSLHTGMIYWANKSQSFCTISELNNHQPPAIWAHLMPLLNLIKEESPNVSVVHFFSDGPSSQYRQKNNFYLLAHFTKCLGLNYATWSYFEAGHGKSVADGIGGCVKRTLDRKVCQGMDVVDAKDAYEILRNSLKRIKVFLIPDSSISDISKILPSNVQPLKGTLLVHQIITRDENSIKFRDVSCFCGTVPGQCDCFSPQIHHVVPSHIQTRVQIKNKRKKVSVCSRKNSATSRTDFKMTNIYTKPPSKNQKHDYSVPSSSKENLRPATSRQDFEMTNIDTEPPIPYSQDLKDLSQEIESFGTLNFESEGNTLIEFDDYENEQLKDPKNDATWPITFIPNDDSKSVEVLKSVAINENVPTKSYKTLQKVNKNTNCFLECQKCTCSILGKKAKCLACSKWYCEECVDGGPMEFDYICDQCLQD